jgi:hypothetical protein
MELALRAYIAAGAKEVTLPHAFGHLVTTADQGGRGLEELIRWGAAAARLCWVAADGLNQHVV